MSAIKVRVQKMTEFRIKAGFTQSALAKASGNSVSLISRLEAGSHNPRPANAVKICKVLGVNFDDLFEIIKRKGVNKHVGSKR